METTTDRIRQAKPGSTEYVLCRPPREAPPGSKVVITVRERDHRDIPCCGRILDPTLDGLRSSPDGFEWGYGGSGPFCTAHSILTHHFTAEPASSRSIITAVHAEAHDFKWDFIAFMPEAGGVITSREIRAWLKGRRHRSAPLPITNLADVIQIAGIQEAISKFEFIKEGKGAFSRDHHQHAENCIAGMKQVAEEGLAALVTSAAIICPACNGNLGHGPTPPGVAAMSRRFWCGHCGYEWFPDQDSLTAPITDKAAREMVAFAIRDGLARYGGETIIADTSHPIVDHILQCVCDPSIRWALMRYLQRLEVNDAPS